MSDNLPDGWFAPTLGFLNREPLVFGIPKGQAGIVVMLGFFSFMITTKTVGIIMGAIVLTVVLLAVLFLARMLYAADPHWWEHMTSRSLPMCRFTGK